MTTYTVFSPDNSDNANRGLTAEQAMDAILTDDGHTYEIVADGDGYWRVMVSINSANSFGRQGGMVQAANCAGFFDNEAEARAGLALLVIRESGKWGGPECMTDEAFDMYLADCAAA